MEQIKNLYKSLTPAQRWSILLCGILLTAGLLWFTHFEREAGFRPLFASLSSEDAAAIVQKLKEGGIDYRIGENGATVMVPEAKVAELRLEMAGAGLPKTGRIGFEIFDKTNFGITDFAEHVNYRRAVEGELERSIISISEVEQARVHVTFPKDSVYLDNREPAKASVLVRLRPGASLSAQNVASITHLVSSAVEGLSANAVTVVDMRGNLLNRPKRTGTDGDISEEALEYQQKVEHDLRSKVAATLEPLLGADKFRVALSAECDMTAGEQSEEVFDPSRSVMVTSQRTEDAPGTTSVASGQPGAAANLPNPPARDNNNVAKGPARRVENITYESSRTTRHIKLAQGGIKRLSIAVLLDQNVEWQGTGAHMQRVLVPPSPEKLKTIHDLVATAVGLTPTRGDQLDVETLPFESTLNSPPPEPVAAPKSETKKPVGTWEQLKANPTALWIGGGVMLMVLLSAFFVVRKKRTRTEIMPAPAALHSSAAAEYDRVALAGREEAEEAPRQSPALQLPPARVDVITTQLRESMARDADLWAGVLRAWLSEEEKA